MVGFEYENQLQWAGGKRGILSSAGKEDLQVATPPEFKGGMAGLWSPEDLLVGAVNACVMTTFLAFAERAGIEFYSYESVGIGRLKPVERSYQITEVEIAVRAVVAEEDIEMVRQLSAKVEAACFISNSIKADVFMEWRIEARAKDSAQSIGADLVLTTRRGDS